jgi:hypothetical protein
MWSHYGSDHKGVCLIFERAYDVPTFIHALSVKYTENLPVLNWTRNFNRDVGDMLFAKHPAWEYERESRIMTHLGVGKYLPFDPSALRGLIFGCRADSAFIADVKRVLDERAAADHPPLRIYRARTHGTKYKLIVRRHE